MTYVKHLVRLMKVVLLIMEKKFGKYEFANIKADAVNYIPIVNLFDRHHQELKTISNSF